jgi:hypothetical protein
MAHKHSHEEEEGGMFGHHDARYNAEQILRNLLLIQDHYSTDPCADCLTKHWSLVLAYADEGLTLDNNKAVRDLLERTAEIGNRHFNTIVSCAVKNVCKVRNHDDLMEMLQEVRSLRKEISMRIYGLVGDVTHDAFDSDYTKALGANLHDTADDIGDDMHGTMYDDENEHVRD